MSLAGPHLSPMHILAIADIHGAVSVFDWLPSLAEEHRVDLVILAGDLSAGSWNEAEQKEQTQEVISALKKIPVPSYYIMGNDDGIDLDFEDDRIKPIYGRRAERSGYGFVGYQYSPPFTGGIFEKPEKEIENDMRELEALLDERTVLVTHSPAFGVLDSTHSGKHVGSRSLAGLLERKSVLAHIHGHIHHSFGREGNHFNVAASRERRAMLIELPSLNHQILRGS